MHNAALLGTILGLLLLVSVTEQTSGTDCSQWLTYRTLDGRCNNLLDPLHGAAGRVMRRGPEGAEYNSDGTPRTDLPIERVVSNKIARPNPTLRDSIRHSLFATQFGQFVNHDIALNRFENPESDDYPVKLDIPDKDDRYLTRVIFSFFNR